MRVIAAFDQLVAHRADIGALARAAAGLAECTAGVHDPLRGVFISVSSDGKNVPAGAIPPTSTVVNVDDGSGAQVWLQRAGGAGPLDAIVAERMAAAAAIILDRMYGSSSYATDLGAVELLLSEQASDVERARCARLLGLAEARLIRAIALVCDRPEPDVVGKALESFTARIRATGAAVQLAKVGDVFAAITTAEAPPQGASAVSARSVSAPRSTRRVLRLPGPPRDSHFGSRCACRGSSARRWHTSRILGRSWPSLRFLTQSWAPWMTSRPSRGWRLMTRAASSSTLSTCSAVPVRCAERPRSFTYITLR